MRIYSIISITQLKSSITITHDSNSYERIFDQKSSLVIHDKLELKRIINKRTIEREIEYLIK